MTRTEANTGGRYRYFDTSDKRIYLFHFGAMRYPVTGITIIIIDRDIMTGTPVNN